MGFAEIILSFIHGAFAGGFGGVAVKKNNPAAAILFLFFMAGAIFWGAKEGWGILLPNSLGFVLGFASVISNKNF